MLANLGDKVRITTAGAYVGLLGTFVGDRDGLARVVLDVTDTILVRPYADLTIIRSIVTETDRLELEVVKARIDELRLAVSLSEAEADDVGGSSLATRMLLDLIPLIDMLPVPEAVRTILKNAAATTIEAM